MINLPVSKKSKGTGKKDPCMYLVYTGENMKRLETLKNTFNCSNAALAAFALECMEKVVLESIGSNPIEDDDNDDNE